MKKFAGILLVLSMLLCLCACGGGEPEPYFGRYHVVKMEYQGIAMGGAGEWLEIKSDTKMVAFLEGEEYSGKLSVDGENLVYTQGGDSYNGTMKGDIIVFDFDGLVITYLKEGATMPVDTSGLTLPEAAADAKIYVAVAGVLDGEKVDQVTLDSLGSLIVVLNTDGTGEFHFFGDLLPITYDETSFVAGGDTLSYTTEGDTISFSLNETMEFTLARVQ